MKEYDGPVFENGKYKEREASKFKQASQRSTTRRSFKPASESREQPYEPAYQASDKMRAPQLKASPVQPERQTDAPTPSEAYEVPFQRQQEGTMLSPERLAASMHDKHVHEAEAEPQPRTLYEPAFKGEARQTEILPEEVEPFEEIIQSSSEAESFQPTQLPKPYRDAQRLAEVDLQTRELAKRLVKSADSFLLFEEE